MAKKINQTKLGNIVKDYYDGNTHIIIYDDALPKTSEEKSLINKKLIQILRNIFLIEQEKDK